MTIVKRYPKLFKFAMFLIPVLLVYYATSSGYDQITQIQTERIEELKSEVRETKMTVTTLRTYANKLESRKTTYRLMLPDGTVEERTTSDMQSETAITDRATLKFEEHIKSEIKRVEDRYSKIVSERRALQVLIGVSSQGRYVGSGTYTIAGPFVAGSTILIDRGLQSPEFTFSLGIEL